MLVLSRKAEEVVVIDGKIRIKIISINGNKVRLGIEAPPDVVVHREEVHERQAAAAATTETSKTKQR